MTRVAVSALLVAVFPFLADGASCNASEKWEHAIAAKGGRDKLESIRTFFWSGEMTVWQGLTRKKHIDQELYVLPSFAWSYHQNSYPGLGSNVIYTYLDRGYSVNTNDSPRGFRRSLRGNLFTGYLAALLMETRWMKPKLRECTAASTQDVVIEAAFNEERYDFYFARGEQLPSKVVLQDVLEWTLSDYKPLGGIMLPAAFRQRDSVGIVLNLNMRYEINPEVPSSLIDSDPTQTMAPEGWRKVKSRK